MSEDETREEFEAGRYLYCVVREEEIDDGGTDGDDGTDETALSTTGIDDEPVRLVRSNDLAAVVHDCTSLYDSDSSTEIQRWLLAHQSVVDDAGEAFGTPLPFQFDTIIRGDDEAMRAWLDSEAESLSTYLDALAGHWEYRVDVVWDEAEVRESLAAEDEELRDLEAQQDEAGEGTQFLLEKQYDTRLNRLLEARRNEAASALEDRLRSHAAEVTNLGQRVSVGLGDDRDDGDRLGRFALLATDDQRDAVGDVLDDVAEESGVEVRFTGPWPPYTFTPELGGTDAPDEG